MSPLHTHVATEIRVWMARRDNVDAGYFAEVVAVPEGHEWLLGERQEWC